MPMRVKRAQARCRRCRCSTRTTQTGIAGWSAADSLEAHGAFWKRVFASPPVPLDLPTDPARPSERSFHGASVRLRLNAELTTGLRRLSRDDDASVFMTLVAVVNLLLARYSGQRDIVAGRVRAELAEQLGFYASEARRNGQACQRARHHRR